MIELAKLVAGDMMNRTAAPVDPVRKAQRTGDQPKPKQPPIAGTQQQAREVNQEDAKLAAEHANRALSSLNTSLRLSINDEAEKLVVSLVEEDTGEVIRQFPPDELLHLSARLKDMVDALYEGSGKVTGTIVDEQR